MPSKRIEYSSHALYQMRERRVSRRQVDRALRPPDTQVPQEANRTRYAKRVRRRGKPFALVVVAEEDARQITVVTVFPSSKITKYITDHL